MLERAIGHKKSKMLSFLAAKHGNYNVLSFLAILVLTVLMLG